MMGVGKSLSTAVTLPILGIGAASVKTAMDFEAQMDRVGAIAGATESDMKKLSDTALDLGANTSKSASEVALGMENIMWQSDFPHAVSIYPDCWKHIEQSLVGVPEEERHWLLCGNAARLYGLLSPGASQ